MIQVSHRPGVTAMPIHGLLLVVNVIFKRIGSAGSLPCHCLVVCRLVTLDFTVKSTRRKRCHVLFFSKFEILPMSTPFRFTCHCVVLGLQNLMDELHILATCIPLSARPSKLRE